MIRHSQFKMTLLGTMLSMFLGAAAWAHGPRERISEISTSAARIFVADAASGDLLSLDLPDGGPIRRLSTPPFIMSLGLSEDHRHLFVMRGRDTDRDWVTVVQTGLTDIAGEWRPPSIARGLPVDIPGPGETFRMHTVGGRDALFMEGTGEIVVFENNNFAGFEPLVIRRYALAAPDHYFYLESGDNLYIGHLRRGYVQVLDRASGAEVARIRGCPIMHGEIMDEETGRLFFSCMRDVVVIGTRGDELNTIVARIPYPEKQRIGAFIRGPGRIIWGYTEGILPVIYRFDAAAEPYRFEVVPLDPSMRQRSTEDGRFLLSLASSGTFEIRDGATGDVLHRVPLSGPFIGEYHEHVDKAILPDIITLDGNAYVSLPHEGRIAMVDLEAGVAIQYFETGGEPTRLAVIAAEGAAQDMMTKQPAGR